MGGYFYVYVLEGENGIYYKGQTTNLDNRLRDHLAGKCRTTKLMGTFKLVFVQLCDSRLEARNLEKYLKSGYGREIIREISLLNN